MKALSLSIIKCFCVKRGGPQALLSLFYPGSLSLSHAHHPFNLETDYRGLHDRKADSPETFQAALKTLNGFKAPAKQSQIEGVWVWETMKK